MECSAVLGSGARCGRGAALDAQLCAYHRMIKFRREARAFYLARLSAEDQEALAAAAGLEGVDAEIAMLRVLTRRVASAADIEAFRRGIDSLCRTLKTKHQLDGRATDRLGARLEAVLGTLGRELGYEEGGQGPLAEGQLRSQARLGEGPWRIPPSLTLPREGGGGWTQRGALAVPRKGGGDFSGPERPSQEVEAAALVLRYQGGEQEALALLHGGLELTILAVLLDYRAFQLPSTMSLQDLQEQSWIVLAELGRRWRPGVSFLGYFMRTFPAAIAHHARQAQPAGRTEVAEAEPLRQAQDGPLRQAQDRSGDQAAEMPEGPFWAADLCAAASIRGAGHEGDRPPGGCARGEGA